MVLALAIAAGLPAALAAPAHAAVTGPTLVGEELLTFTNVETQGPSPCPQTATTMSFRAEGVATGPFSGTFTATGSYVLSAPSPEGNGTGRDVLGFDETFTIFSPAGVVTGTKRLSLSDFVGGEAGVCENADVAGGRTIWAQVPVEYFATIDSPFGTYSDTGVGFTFTAREDVADIGLLNYFQEIFLNSFGPLETPGHATGGGQLGRFTATSGVTFGFTARSTDDGRTSGSCSVVDHATNEHVRCETVETYTEVGNTVAITGAATVDGVPTRYRIAAQDVAEPGNGVDTFSIVTDSGYSAGGTVTVGNVQVHR